MPELFLSAIKNLASGSLTDILRSPNGFHILRVNDRRGDVRTARVTQTHVRHILLKSSEIQSLDDARAKLTQLRERIENGDDFAALARAHSEDPGSAINGGDLGWVSPGQLVPEFEKAMSALKPNGLSAPVRSPFGLHLIQVLERRDQDVTQGTHARRGAQPDSRAQGRRALRTVVAPAARRGVRRIPAGRNELSKINSQDSQDFSGLTRLKPKKHYDLIL